MRTRMKATMPLQAYRYLQAERAMMQLAKIARHIGAEDFAQYLIERDPDGRRLGEPGNVRDWLGDAWEITKRVEEAKAPKCAVCGKDWSERLDRPNARYCSDRCRQKAYRERNGSHVSETTKA
jgi:hypothetical protein